MNLNKKHLVVSIVLFCLMGFSAPAISSRSSKVPDIKITAEQFDSRYNEVSQELNAITAQIPAQKLKKIKSRHSDRNIKWTQDQLHLKKRYMQLLQEKKFLDPMYELREALFKLYTDNAPNSNYSKSDLRSECTFLAVGLVQEIARLEKSYRLFHMPVVHNMMISVGIRKRGACKHWAEDLLLFMRPLDRKFFHIAWGEAKAGKMGEHNVAVVVPKGSHFDKGMMIDPWRTAGKPFWLNVTEDKHYKWSRWSGWEGM